MSKVKILVVEDEVITAEHIKIALEKQGYLVVGLIGSGEEAISKVEDGNVDLVLMDINLKGDMDGVEAAEKVRDRFGIPVIFLTAYSDQKTVQRAKLIEPSGFIIKESFGMLNKPFREEELHSTIEITLYRNKMEKRIREHERWLKAVFNSISDALIATDSVRQIKFMNQLAEDLTGWIDTEAIGSDLSEIFQISDIESSIKEALQDLTSVPIKQNILISKDGSHNLIDGSITPIKDENEEIKGLIVNFRLVNK